MVQSELITRTHSSHSKLYEAFAEPQLISRVLGTFV